MYMRLFRLSCQEVITRYIQHSIGRDIHKQKHRVQAVKLYSYVQKILTWNYQPYARRMIMQQGIMKG